MAVEIYRHIIHSPNSTQTEYAHLVSDSSSQDAQIIQRSIERTELAELIDLDNLAMFAVTNTPPDHAPPSLTIKELNDALENNQILEGLFLNEKLIAYYWSQIREKDLYLASIAVHPNYRQMGLGKYLMEQFEAEARQRLIHTSTLSVDPFNTAGLRTFFKSGYKIIDYQHAYFGDTYPNTQRFIMRKHLEEQVLNLFDNVTKIVPCHHVQALQDTIREGFYGTSVLISPDQNPKNNLIYFKKRLPDNFIPGKE